MKEQLYTYKPFAFIAVTFAITWACAFFLALQPWLTYETTIGTVVLAAVSFLESASPLLAALLLWRRPLFREGGILRFVFGHRPRLLPYAVVVLLFVFQYLTFYLFRMDEGMPFSLRMFLAVWGGQILFGGGMEEGGWRGYLQPALEQKVHITIAVLLVGGVWAAWHLPYFFLPGNMHSGGNFLFYIITTTATAFTLTAIYKLTGSVLLCMLFHGWQNAIVMNIPANMAHPGFLAMFLIQTAASIALCVKPAGATGRLPAV